jgi:hypothetical protein
MKNIHLIPTNNEQHSIIQKNTGLLLIQTPRKEYSEDEVKRIAFDFYYDMSHKMNVPENLISENATNVDEWFRQFKKR